MNVETMSLVRELTSAHCRCGRPKGQGKSFCYRCFGTLPSHLKTAMYKRIGEGYEEAHRQAVEYLDAFKVTPRRVMRAG